MKNALHATEGEKSDGWLCRLAVISDTRHPDPNMAARRNIFTSKGETEQRANSFDLYVRTSPI